MSQRPSSSCCASMNLMPARMSGSSSEAPKQRSTSMNSPTRCTSRVAICCARWLRAKQYSCGASAWSSCAFQINRSKIRRIKYDKTK